MRRKHRGAAVAAGWLAILMLLSGCSTLPQPNTSSDTVSGGENSEVPLPQHPSEPRLAYRATDSLHPCRASSRVNRQLLSLLYEGLTRVDAAWEAQAALASSWELTDATHLTVTLREGAVFSDGTPVTAEDVVTSFRAAKASSYYGNLLQNVSSVRAQDERTLTVTLVGADPLAANALSFPVFREAGETCLGTGPYRAEGTALVANTYAVTAPAEPRWELWDVSREDEMAYALETGDIAYYFTELSEGKLPRTLGSVGQTAVTLNELLFLGVNASQKPFSEAAVRTALSAALSRRVLCTGVLQGCAIPAVTPFIPTWSGAKTLSGWSETENVALAVAKWQELGYNNWDTELLVCADRPLHAEVAQELAAQCAAAGLTLQVVSVDAEEYASRIARGRFTLYLGEIRFSADLSLRPLLQAGGAASSGVSAESRACYSRYLAGELSAEEFCAEFLSDMPYIPLGWRQGLGVYRTDVREVSPSGARAYDGIEHWTVG